MDVKQLVLASPNADIPPFPEGGHASLLMVFGPREWLEMPGFLEKVKASCPADTKIVGCSTAGEITEAGAHAGDITLTYLRTATTDIEVKPQVSSSVEHSLECGRSLADGLGTAARVPAHGLIFSGALALNGSKLVEGLQLGFAGWCPFRAFRTVTSSASNRLDQIDSRPALDIYSAYLGGDAWSLPSSGLLYPLEVVTTPNSSPLIRTLLAVDRESGTDVTGAGTELPNQTMTVALLSEDR